MRPIRNSAKAIIIRDRGILVTEAVDEDGPWYLLPSGGQEPGEVLRDTLIRECREEIDARVSVRELRFIREYIGRNHEFASSDGEAHQVEFMFLCDIDQDYSPVCGALPDPGQIAVRWLELDRLTDYRLYPRSIRTHLMAMPESSAPIYLGDIN